MTPIRLVVVDDHRLFLLAVRTVLQPAEDIEIVGEADSGAKALSLVAATRPDLVLMDFSMPHLDGLACLETIKSRHPEVKVAIMSTFHDADVVEPALRNGASAFILKSINPEDLAAVIRHVVTGTVIQSFGLSELPTVPSEQTHDLTERARYAFQHGLGAEEIVDAASPTVS